MSVNGSVLRVAAWLGRLPGETWVTTSAAAGMALVAALSASFLWLEWNRVVGEAKVRTADYARLLEQQTIGTFRSADVALLGIVDDLTRNSAITRHDPQLEESLREKVPLLPGVRALFVVGPDGYVTQTTDNPKRIVNVADRDYFRFHQSEAGGLHVGHPLRGRMTGNWFISLSRRVEGPNGGFGGLVAAAVEPAHYEDFYRQLQLDRDDALALFHKDGTLLFRVPADEGTIGENFSSLRLFREGVARRSEGSFWGEGRLGGRPRLVSYRAASEAPLVVTVAFDRSKLLAGWRRTAWAMLALYFALGAAVWALASAWARRLRERSEAQRRALAMQKLESLGQIAGSMAHDFGNVLATTRAALQTIERIAENPQVSAYTQAADRSVEHGARLVDQLRAFARGQQLELRRLDVADLLRRLESTLRQAAGPNVRLRLQLPQEPLPCLLDRTQFDAALLNLVANARDAMPRGGEIRIRAGTVKSAAGWLQLAVEDDGDGIRPEIQERIFEPFYTTKADKGGTGLGLSQVYGFVKQIGGQLRLHSAPNAGAAFELLLPSAASVSVPAAAPHGRPATAPSQT